MPFAAIIMFGYSIPRSTSCATTTCPALPLAIENVVPSGLPIMSVPPAKRSFGMSNMLKMPARSTSCATTTVPPRNTTKRPLTPRSTSCATTTVPPLISKRPPTLARSTSCATTISPPLSINIAGDGLSTSCATTTFPFVPILSLVSVTIPRSTSCATTICPPLPTCKSPVWSVSAVFVPPTSIIMPLPTRRRATTSARLPRSTSCATTTCPPLPTFSPTMRAVGRESLRSAVC